MSNENWFETNSELLIDISNKIWNFAEPSLKEEKSSALLQKVLREAGFEIQNGLSGMSTAFLAKYGQGKPTIGFLGEFDAISGMSQKSVPHKEPEAEGAAGHGCGHNLLGTASLGAALALQEEIRKKNIEGTVIFFGCPAEEIMMGKILMARDGYFDGLDAVLSWHPWYVNSVMEQSLLAMNTAKFTFHGTPAHAAAAPELGRSALDAVELMNIGVNYLREHVPSDVRIHYSITNGGGEPNLVHDLAQSWYYVRAPRRETVDSVFQRIVKIAKGAAEMTETQEEIELISGCWDNLQNKTLSKLLHSCMEDIEVPKWNEEEENFANEIAVALPEGQVQGIRKAFGTHFSSNSLLDEGVLPLTDRNDLVFSSSDVSDVSWIAPVGQITTCCAPLGSQWHTWPFTASVGMSIGHKGMLYASRVLALAGSRLLQDSRLIKDAWMEFEKEKDGRKYKCVI